MTDPDNFNGHMVISVGASAAPAFPDLSELPAELLAEAGTDVTQSPIPSMR